MTEPSLAHRLLARIGQISRRSDVVVQVRSPPRSGPIGKWKGVLPADMLAFYEVVNGLKFHYSFAGDDGYHGLEFLALDDGGRKTIDTFRNTYRLPRQAARRYPEHFFQPGAVSPDTPVLFFFGDDSAWGIVMTGQGEDVSFHHWDNDGFLKPLGSSFTALVERLIARGFAHTWAYSDTHPDTDEVLRRLAIDSPPRKTFELTVETLATRSAEDVRRALIASWSPEVHDKVLRALGMTKQAKGASAQDKMALIHDACATAESITGKMATSIMKAIGYQRRNRDDFVAFFRCGGGPVTSAKLRLTYLPGPIPVQLSGDVLLRVLGDIEGLHVMDGFPGSPDVLACMRPSRFGIHWTPFLGVSWNYEFKGEPNKVATFDVTLDAERARGLEAGKTYASSALPSVEDRIG